MRNENGQIKNDTWPFERNLDYIVKGEAYMCFESVCLCVNNNYKTGNQRKIELLNV